MYNSFQHSQKVFIFVGNVVITDTRFYIIWKHGDGGDLIV